MKQDFSLVSDEYYKEELAYQATIDASKNSAVLSAPASVSVYNKEVVIRFPEEFSQKQLSGSIHFYSPVTTSLDRKFDVAVVENAMRIDRSKLGKTNYVVKLTWNAEGKTYYQETSLNLH
jgi:nitrogen fixation protein FixH